MSTIEEDFGDLNETTERSPVDANSTRGRDANQGRGQRQDHGAPPPTNRGRQESIPRERRPTMVSSIPAELAKSMMGELHDTRAPATMEGEPTRPLTDSSQPKGSAAGPTEEVVDTYSVELIDDDPELPPLEHIQSLIDRARTLLENGNLGGAVMAADQTLAEAAKAPQADVAVAALVKAARPLFDRIFADYVGLLGQTPVRMRSDADLVGQELGERTKYLLAHIDGKQTLEEVSANSGIPPVEAMKIAASLLAAGIVRV
ncbi:MAG TPA: hypothetical protein VFH68_09895 [Polyangia bacterium]|nr:hypothetical protein [Polyangia bacterium]